MARRRLAIIEAGRGREAAFAELRESGEFTVLFASRRPVPDSIGRLVDEVLPVDTNDPTATVDALRGSRLDGALTLLEWYVPVAEAVRAALGLPGNGERTALICRDKHLMRERLRAAGLPVPRFVYLNGVGEPGAGEPGAGEPGAGEPADALRAAGGPPCVLKPVDGTGSTNVVLVHTEDELREGLDRIWRQEVNSRDQRLARRALLEQYVDGPEYAVDSLSAGGRHVAVAVHEYVLSPLPYFTETAYFMPPRLSAAGLSAVTGLAVRALDAVGITSGPSHCEVKWGRDGPVVVEVAARYGGAHLPELIRATTGVRYYLEGARIACGATALPAPRRRSAGAMCHVYAGEPGVLVGLDGLAGLRELPGYLAAHPGVPGARVGGEVRDYTAAAGHVLFTAPTAAEALARAEAAAARLRPVVRPGMVHS